ncbi:MAG: hypothetical protein RIS94_1224 [Pseudomonadota bacterium]|jgi:CheY-like chemotaxis protein
MIAPGESAPVSSRLMRVLRRVSAIWPRRPAPSSGTSAELASLRRERDAAKAASAAKSRYLASVSHEIRSPLNAIYGYAQLLERDSAVDPREAARVIRRSAEHLTDLVEGLLDISLVENGVLRVAQDTVRLPQFIEQVERMFRPAAQAKGLAFRCELPSPLPEFVRTDQKRLRQVLINLLSNAIKYTERGTVTLSVRYAGLVAVFEVRDTGPGIADDRREAIFAPFDRGGSPAGEGGFGLGLPITRALVQILGGELEVESSPGGGSCFRVRLLLGKVVGPRDEGIAPAPIVGYDGARRSIIVMDDDPAQLAFIRQALEELGFDVATAPDGETALALCHSRNFDLALLDIAMPGPSGWETAAHLRATQGSNLAIVMLSANAHERHGPEGRPAPHDRFLVKPVEIDALVDTVGDLLGLVWQRRAVPAAAPARTEPSVLPPAARPHVEALRELLKLGHVRGIEAEIRHIEAAAPQATGLVATLYDCLDRFDLAALGRAVESL